MYAALLHFTRQDCVIAGKFIQPWVPLDRLILPKSYTPLLGAMISQRGDAISPMTLTSPEGIAAKHPTNNRLVAPTIHFSI